MVLFTCLALITFVILPQLWWLIVPLYTSCALACWRYYSQRTPKTGSLLLLPEKAYMEVHCESQLLKGQLLRSTLWFDSLLECHICNSQQRTTKVMLHKTAVAPSDWRILCRMANLYSGKAPEQ